MPGPALGPATSGRPGPVALAVPSWPAPSSRPTRHRVRHEVPVCPGSPGDSQERPAEGRCAGQPHPLDWRGSRGLPTILATEPGHWLMTTLIRRSARRGPLPAARRFRRKRPPDLAMSRNLGMSKTLFAPYRCDRDRSFRTAGLEEVLTGTAKRFTRAGNYFFAWGSIAAGYGTADGVEPPGRPRAPAWPAAPPAPGGCAHPAMREHLRIGWSRSARTLRKASRMSAAVEKRSTLAGAHALMRNSARPGLRSKRIVLGSVTGTSTMGLAYGNGWWPLQRSR